MYKFVFQKDKTDIEIILIQAMLVLAAVAVFAYRHEGYEILSYILAIVLLAAAVLAKPVLIARGLNKWLLLPIAAVLLFAATWQLYFPLVLLFYGALVKLLVKAPELTVDENGVVSKTLFSQKRTAWEAFNTVMIKDGLLVLDHKNNRVQYLPFTENVNEQEFNAYCAKFTAQ